MKGRRYIGGGHAKHADDWLITYADTITLLLCLFVVLLALHGAELHSAVHVEAPSVRGCGELVHNASNRQRCRAVSRTCRDATAPGGFRR